jgi:hypothetical protein
MNFLPTPIPFKRHDPDAASGAAPEISAIPEADRTSVADPDPIEALEPDLAPAVAATPLRLFGFAALSGAVAASVVVLVVSVFPLRSNQDPRTLQLLHDLTDLTARVQTLADRTRTVETEDVAASQTIGAIDHRLSSTTDELNAIRTALGTLTADQQQRRDAMAGINAPALFGVAAVQLRDRIEAGLPFDWELVDLRGIVGGDPGLLAELDRLAPMSITGVVTQQRLNDAMQVLLTRDGPRSSLVQASLGVVSRVLGPDLITPPAADAQLLGLAAARLSVGDLPNFVRLMQGLNGPTALAARPVLLAARQRMIALDAVQRLLGAARSGLQAQLRLVSTPPMVQPRP